jgi:hypothetical protein
VTVDARGNPIPIMDTVDGQVTDVDRNPNYRGGMRNDSIFEQWLRQKLLLPSPMPMLTAPRQDATTQRDQMVDLATRGLPGTPASGQATAKRLAGQEMARLTDGGSLEGRFRYLENGENLSILDGEIVKVLDADWRSNA